MKLLIFLAVFAVAAARPDYHDDVFHFSTLKSSSPVARARAYQRPAVSGLASASPLSLTQHYTLSSAPAPALHTLQTYQPVYTQIHHIHHQPVYSQFEQRGLGLGLTPLTQLTSSSPVPVSLPAPARSHYAPTYGGHHHYRILKHEQRTDPTGPYRLLYATENGISASEDGSLTAPGPEGPAVAKQGSYSYTGPDNVRYTVNWIADENGFRASGAHLPTPPPIPAEIRRSLELNSQYPTNK